MKRVIALTKYADKGASSRVRFVNLFEHLERLGWSVLWHPLLSNTVLDDFYKTGKYPLATVMKAYCERFRLLASLKTPNVWWIEKEIYYGFPEMVEAPLAESILARAVLDFDDGVFLNYSAEEWRPLGRYQKFTGYAKRAGLITYGSEGIRRRMVGWGANRLLKIPSTVDVSRYVQHEFRPSGGLIIGWIGTPVTKVFLDKVSRVLQQLATRVEFELHVIGAIWECEGVKVRCIEWSEDAEAKDVARFDIGIMPLGKTEWDHCKCGYKLIQYMAAGVVPVGSAIGENREIIRHGETGFLCGNDREWLYTLEFLARDRGLCAQIGRTARLEAERKYDNRNAANLVAAALEMVGGDTPSEI